MRLCRASWVLRVAIRTISAFVLRSVARPAHGVLPSYLLRPLEPGPVSRIYLSSAIVCTRSMVTPSPAGRPPELEKCRLRVLRVHREDE